MQALGIDPVVWSVWAHRGSEGLQIEVPFDGPQLPPVSNSSCFWKPSHLGCADFYAATRGASGHAVPYADVATGALRTDKHDTGSAAVWRKCAS